MFLFVTVREEEEQQFMESWGHVFEYGVWYSIWSWGFIVSLVTKTCVICGLSKVCVQWGFGVTLFFQGESIKVMPWILAYCPCACYQVFRLVVACIYYRPIIFCLLVEYFVCNIFWASQYVVLVDDTVQGWGFDVFGGSSVYCLYFEMASLMFS